MPSNDVIEAYRRARDSYEQSTRELIPRLVQVAVESVADVLAGALQLEVLGELNEDWIPTLRIQRILDVDGAVLFDNRHGHADRAVEDMVDTVDVEYLDVLIDLTGDEYMGSHTIDRPPTGSTRTRSGEPFAR